MTHVLSLGDDVTGRVPWRIDNHAPPVRTPVLRHTMRKLSSAVIVAFLALSTCALCSVAITGGKPEAKR